MRYVQAKRSDNADAHRLASLAIQPGGVVLLDARNIRTIRPSCKLDDKNTSPFAALRQVNPRAYELTSLLRWNSGPACSTVPCWSWPGILASLGLCPLTQPPPGLDLDALALHRSPAPRGGILSRPGASSMDSAGASEIASWILLEHLRVLEDYTPELSRL